MKSHELDRRAFLKVNAVAVGSVLAGSNIVPAHDESVSGMNSPIADVDFEALVSRSDLFYHKPLDLKTMSGAAGHPIGNGRMGTAVWTTPQTVQFQINRVDVFATNREHHGKFMGAKDYCGACAAITIDVGGQPFAAGAHYQHHLSVYHAENSIRGDDVTVRCFVSAESDVLVLEIDDRRSQPQPVRFTLSLWGEPSIRIEDHVAQFAFVNHDDKYGLTRTFSEREYMCRSAVVVQAIGSHVELESATPIQHTFRIDRAVPGKTRIHIASAASMNAADVTAQALAILNTVKGKSYAQLQKSHRAWWSRFWSRTFVHLSSPDGVADFMERLRTTYLYVMASTARGKIPPKWNAMLFAAKGDERYFGAQYWGWTMEPLYISLFAAGASDLADPYFNLYVDHLPNARLAAAQRWNAKGAYFPEVMTFDGPLVLPDEIGRELRQPWPFAPSDRLRALIRYDPQLLLTEQVSYNCVSHIMAVGARVAMHAWWRYRCTGDTAWLRTHAYPLLKDTAEFYRSYAVWRDGQYHFDHTNVHESYVYVNDGIIDIAVIRGTIPLAVRAAEILGVDAELRTAWRDFVNKSAPYVMGSDPDAKALKGATLADDVWAVGRNTKGSVGDSRGDEDPWLNPVFPFEDYTLECRDPEMTRIVRKLVELSPIRQKAVAGTLNSVTVVRTPVAVVRAGFGEELPQLLSGYYRAFNPRLPNGFSTFEGGEQGGAVSSVEHLGMITMTLQEGLLQSVSPRPGEPEIIRVFPAWPKSWDGTFTLVARGGFLVTSAQKNGVIPFVDIESRQGEMCQIRNPWTSPCFLAEPGKRKQQHSGDVIRFPTKAGKRYRLFPHEPPKPIRVAPANAPQASLTFTHADGTVAVERLGID